MRAAAARLWARLGRRGTDLLIFGALELIYGWGIVSDPRYGVVRGVGVLTAVAPMTLWGALWMASGIIAIALATHPPFLRDSWGYAALFGPMGLWACANFGAWITGDFRQAYTSAATWGLLALHLLLSNRRPELLHLRPDIHLGGTRGGA